VSPDAAAFISGAQEMSSEPTPVRAYPEIAVEAFSGLTGEIVNLISPHTESDPVTLLMHAHACFGNVIGRGPYFRIESTEHAAKLFVLQVGDTSKSRKGTGADRIRHLFSDVDRDWSNRRVHTGLSSGEGVIWEVRDPITKIVRDGKGPNAPMVEEISDAGVTDKRLMIIETEFAGALQMTQRDGNILSRVLRDAWDRGDLASLTKNSPARATAAHISMVGHITKSELVRYLNRTEMANGFANRFLFACVRRSKLLPFGGHLDDAALFAMAERVRDAVQRARNIGRVQFNPEAAKGWEMVYETLSADRPGLIGALTARAEAYVVRLAMLYALWDGSSYITLANLEAAIAVWEFCYASVDYLFADMLGDETADTILGALRQAATGLTRTAISGLFHRNKSAREIELALTELLARRLAIKSSNPALGPGRLAETWHAVR